MKHLSHVPVNSPFPAKTPSNISWSWLNWFQDVWDRITNFSPPGPFADDVTAKKAGVQIGCVYYDSSGAVKVRLA